MVRPSVPYEAYYFPGLNDDTVDPDEVLDSAFEWLRTMAVHGQRFVVMNSIGMVRNRRNLAAHASRFPVVSPRSRIGPSSHTHNVVLAIWPTNETLDFAERLTLRGSLCVIPGTIDDVSHWVRRAQARSLFALASDEEASVEVPPDVREILDFVVDFDGHNDFIGAGGKEHAIRHLQAIVQRTCHPRPVEIETYVLERGVRSSKGARRLREWYEGLLAGKRFRDSSGRVI